MNTVEIAMTDVENKMLDTQILIDKHISKKGSTGYMNRYIDKLTDKVITYSVIYDLLYYINISQKEGKKKG